MCVVIETAKTVLEHIQTLLPEVKSERSYIPIADVEVLEELEKPLVLVIADDRECTKATQAGSRENTIIIHIAFNKKLQNIGMNDELTQEIDELIEMQEKVYNDFLKKIKLGTDKFRVVADQPEHLFLSDPESIQTRNCFLGVIQIIAKVFEITND